ncbi:L-Aspartase-like protein [Xylaria sp. FL1042]|nr:L-Aspartase-like protein [Xylaria sp. FL1042]
MANPVYSFTDLVLSHWCDPWSSHKATVSISGGDLTIADVVAVSRDLAQVKLTSESMDAIEACSKVIQEKLAKGDVIYGVNTGFGGSANTRSNDVERVQQSLISHLTCGIITDGKQKPAPKINGHSSQSNGETRPGNKVSIGQEQQRQRALVRGSLPLNDPLAATCMPESWVRASMLTRLNSLAGGASGIRVDIAECLMNLLNEDVVPRIPVRGSISASGDLSTLAWIGALMQGKPSATAFAGPRHIDGARKVKTADLALSEAGIAPISLHAKEGLAIVNGTAVSAGVAALAVHESLNLAALSQVLTAMSVEALRGSDESFEPFIARMRPHAGQMDSARNISAFLTGSQLLNRHDSKNVATLRQDRYSLRTASQWIGPVLEDFCLAHHQLTVELNSVTDNPLIDVATGRVFHGGNFQARAVTSAVEKLRQGLQSIGRMLFSQCTEMINPDTSWGLPPNLCSDDPNHSFLFKGLDVVIAGLTSELGFLANPVGSHVQTAEMGNQSLNSLALVSARYTLEAVDVLSQIASVHLLALCQALDLRTMEIEGRKDLPPDATPYIGQASRRMYHFIRKDLGIPFLGEEHLASTEAVTLDGVTPSIGLYNTRVYESIRSGRLYDVVLESLKEVKDREQPAAVSSNGNVNDNGAQNLGE